MTTPSVHPNHPFNSALSFCKDGVNSVITNGKKWGSHLIGEASKLAVKLCNFVQPFFKHAHTFVTANPGPFSLAALILVPVGVLAISVYAVYACFKSRSIPAGRDI